MKFDLLKKVIAELSEQLVNARVDKIHQPAADIIIFRLWTGKENVRLLISADPVDSRIHLTTASYPNPFTPPRFCQLLRARVSRFLRLEVLNNDRIVAIHCSGLKGENTLIVELTGRSSNMLLLDNNNIIIDSLKRISGNGNHRQMTPGQPYQLPFGSELVNDKGMSEQGDDRELSANTLVEKLYSQGHLTENKTDLASVIQAAIIKQQKKLKRRLDKIREEQGRQENFERFKQLGDLLLANLHLVKRGMEMVEVLDHYLQPAIGVTISLDSRLSPQDNAESYFKRYKKAKRGLEHSRRRMQETQDELAWLESIDFQAREASTAAEIEDLVLECRQNGLLQGKKDRYAGKQKRTATHPKEAVSPNGHKIYWGRSNRQNDYVTSEVMKAGDLWFHAYQNPGAHLVLKGNNTRDGFADEDVQYAAALAAGYSKARGNTKVEVMLAEPKNVRKPKGAKPGLVTVRHHKTLVVKPLRLE